jgi:hypothetical protein
MNKALMTGFGHHSLVWRKTIYKRQVDHFHAGLGVGRARRYVWAQDDWQADFIEKYMSTQMEPTPLFAGLGVPGAGDGIGV